MENIDQEADTFPVHQFKQIILPPLYSNAIHSPLAFKESVAYSDTH